MTNYKRVKYGSEKQLNLGLDKCPICAVQPGKHHEYGCFAEECPECHCILLNCHCRSIDPYEGQLHIKAISESFESPEEVLEIFYRPIVSEVPSLLTAAAWVTIFDMMGLEPKGYDDLGDPLYSAEDVNSFGMLEVDCV
jgi:hypothetical protein